MDIRHTWLDAEQAVRVTYDATGTRRLEVIVDGNGVYLTEEETTRYLAQMARWHRQHTQAARARSVAADRDAVLY